MKRRWYECGQKRSPSRAVVTAQDGTILWVCRQCWNRLDYAVFWRIIPAETR